MSDQATTVDQEVLAVQMAIIDRAIREARAQGWCGEFDRAMARIFPDGPPDGSTMFVDSDGWSCHWYDRDGFHRDSGTDRYGYGRDGYDGAGYDRDGWSREGRNRYGYDRDGYDANGYDRYGWSRDSVNRDGYTRDSDEYRARFRFDRWGYDRDGYDRNGRDRQSLTREQRATLGDAIYRYDYDPVYGLVDVDGRDTDGYPTRGVDAPRVEPADRQALRAAGIY
jgi:hypothetical protein